MNIKMNINEFQEIYEYLKYKKYLQNIQERNTKERFENKVKRYLLINNQLYYEKGEKKLKVIKKFELEPILYMTHDDLTAGYFAIEIMYNKIKEKYYWPKMYEDIKIYVESCDQCQRRRKLRNKNELHNIKVIELFYQIGIDIIRPLSITSRGKKYIVTAIDYFTKWAKAKVLKEANAYEVATFIYKKIIYRHRCLRKILTDRGTHFNNKMIEELMKKFNIKYNFSTPYHPKINGLVERFNKTLCESLVKLVEERNNWDQYLMPSLFAYNTSKQNLTKIEPFYL